MSDFKNRRRGKDDRRAPRPSLVTPEKPWTRVEAALADLVRLKDLKEWLASGTGLTATRAAELKHEYETQKEPAWDEARKALEENAQPFAVSPRAAPGNAALPVLQEAEKLFGQFALLAAQRNWSPDSMSKIVRLQDWTLAAISAVSHTEPKKAFNRCSECPTPGQCSEDRQCHLLPVTSPSATRRTGDAWGNLSRAGMSAPDDSAPADDRAKEKR